MDKEVKIALAIIMSLLIVFGVVLTKRLIVSSGDTMAAISTGDIKRTNPPSTNDQPIKKKKNKSNIIEVAKPTVVAADLNKSLASRLDIVSDKDNVKPPQRNTADSSLPSYMPKPTTPASSSYSACYVSSIRQPTTTDPCQQSNTVESTYVVEEGDTLFDIARHELGEASRWVEIYELNRDRLGNDHDYLTPGLKLIMPNDARTDRVTLRPGTNSGL